MFQTTNQQLYTVSIPPARDARSAWTHDVILQDIWQPSLSGGSGPWGWVCFFVDLKID